MSHLSRFGAIAVLAFCGASITARQAHASSFSFATSFNSLSANESLYGMAALDGGVLELTNAINVAFGAYVLDLGAIETFDSFSASWQSLIGGGLAGGADGYSFNVAADLPATPTYGNPGEEGAGTGVTVTVDTFDNSFVDPGDIVGIEILWNGTVLASQVINKDDPGTGVFLRKNAFVSASVTVTAAGLVTFVYDGNVIQAALPGYSGLLASQIMFGARTGGANDNHWIDDLSISGETRNATVPEPATFLLFGAGLAAAGVQRRRRRS